jgi:hypothetical protein
MMIRRRARFCCCSVTLVATFCVTAPAVAQSVLASPPSTASTASQQEAARPLTSFSTPRSVFDVPPTSPGNLFQASIDDFRRLPSRDTWMVLGIGAMAALIGHTMDKPVDVRMSQPALAKPFGPGDFMGTGRAQIGGAIATYTLGRVVGSPRITKVGAELIRAQVITKTLTTTLKASVRRTRPDGTLYSFPSGHTSAGFATATVLHRNFGWKVGVPAYGVASYIAASRLQDKKHFLSDVAFGAAIGIIAGRTVTVGRGDARFALAPVAAPGGGGVSFTWVGN